MDYAPCQTAQEENMAATDKNILVIIPILNEIKNIKNLIDGLFHALEGYRYTILFIDDESTDGTLEYLDKRIAGSKGRIVLLKERKTLPSCQRGAALFKGVKWGVQNGPFDIFVEMDGDMSHRPEEITIGIEIIAAGTADVAIASKYAHGSAVTNRPWGRRLVSRILNTAVRTIINWRIADYSNGYRFYTWEAAEIIPQYWMRYGSPIYLSEALALWLLHGLRVTEFASVYLGRYVGFSKVRIRDYVMGALGVLEIASRYHVLGFKRLSPGPAVRSSLAKVWNRGA